jgi:hypothetical protein
MDRVPFVDQSGLYAGRSIFQLRGVHILMVSALDKLTSINIIPNLIPESQVLMT